MKHFLLLFSVLALMIASSETSNSQVPRVITYQGVVLDNLGHFIPDGAHNINLKLYDALAATSPIYSENQIGVVFVKGIFNVMIGSVTAIPNTIAFDKGYFLGVSVDGGIEMTPRTPLSAAPYAIHAGMADALSPTATGVVTSVNSQAGAITLVGGGGTTITNVGAAFTISSSGGGGTGIQGVQTSDASLTITNPNGPTATINVANNGITSSKIAGLAVGTASIADGAVTPLKLSAAGSTNGQVLTSNGTAVSWQNSLGGGLVLPYAGTVTSASDAFAVSNGGTGSAIVGVHSATTGATAALRGESNSTTIGAIGVYGSINTPLAGSTSVAIRAENKGNAGLGIGLWGSQAGSGWGVYGTTPDGNSIYGYATASGTGVLGQSVSGVAGIFSSTNASNTSDVLEVSTLGTGKGAVISLTNVANSANALQSTSVGTGRAGYFENTNSTPSTPTLEVKTASTASATLGILSTVSNTTTGLSNVAAAIKGSHQGTTGIGIGVWGEHTGTGVGVFGSVSGNGGYGVSATGFGNNSTAILATYSGGATVCNVLELNNGYIKVSGANKTSYIHVTTAGNVAVNRTTLNYPGMNATDIVIVSHNFVAAFLKGGYGVWWNGAAWTIFEEDNTLNMPVGEKFNVLVIKQ